MSEKSAVSKHGKESQVKAPKDRTSLKFTEGSEAHGSARSKGKHVLVPTITSVKK